MASYSTAIAVSFNGSSFIEVTGLSWTWGGGLSKGRNIVWTDDAGTVSIESLFPTSTGVYGVRGTLAITGGGLGLTCTACCTSVSAAAELNGVTRYAVEFKIIQ